VPEYGATGPAKLPGPPVWPQISPVIHDAPGVIWLPIGGSPTGICEPRLEVSCNWLKMVEPDTPEVPYCHHAIRVTATR
jgi:hypothetical protein